jgi:hypothetical protein
VGNAAAGEKILGSAAPAIKRDPKGKLPGTKMVFAGLEPDQEIDAVTYLNSSSETARCRRK